MSVNLLVYDGFLARDPKKFDKKNGDIGVAFTIIWSEKWGRLERKCFLPVVCFMPKIASAILKYEKRGSHVQVVGQMISREVDKDGKKAWILQLELSKIYFVGAKKDSDQEEEPADAEREAPCSDDSIPEEGAVQMFDPEDDEEIIS